MAVRKEAQDYWAFISYSQRDARVAKWLHRALETYSVPRPVRGRTTPLGVAIPARLRPVFRDRDELPASSNLPATLRGALDRSHWLVVLCSPSSAGSAWVDAEVRYFIAQRGAARVLCVLLDGEPNAGNSGNPPAECLPPVLRSDASVSLLHPDRERTSASPLAADLRRGRDSRRVVLLKVVAGILCVDLDVLAQRDRTRAWVLQATTALAIVAMTGAGLLAWRWRDDIQRTSAITALQRQLHDELRRERFGAAASHALELLSLGDDSTVNRLLLGWSLDRAGNRFLTPGFEVGTRQDPLPIDGSLSGKGDELVLVDGAGRATLYSISGAQAAVVATLGQGDAAVPHRIVRARFAPGLGLLADGQFGPARLWSTPAGVAIAELRPPTGRVPVIGEEFIVVADHRGRRIAGATRRSGGVSLWSVPGMQRTEVRAPDRAGVQRLVFSADDRLLAVLNAAGSISIHDAGTGQQLHSIETGATTIDLQFLPGRSELLVLFEKSLELVTLQGSRTALRLDANQGYVQDVAVDAQGERVAGALSDGTIALWDLGRGAHRAALKDELASTDELTSDLGPPIDLSSYGEGERVTQGMAQVAFAGNDALLVGMHTRGRICVWSIETLQTLLCMDGPRGRRLGMRRAAMLDRFLVWGEARQDGGQPRVFDLPIRTESQGALRKLIDALPADPMGPQ